MHLLYQIFIDPFVQMGSRARPARADAVGGPGRGRALCADRARLRADLQGLRRVQFRARHHGGVRRAHAGRPATRTACRPFSRSPSPSASCSCWRSRSSASCCGRLVNQPDIILFMATFGLTYILIGSGELMFGGDPKVMITNQLLLPSGSYNDQDAGRLRADAEDRHRRRHHRLADGGERWRCSSRRRASGARCARSPTATAPRSRSAFRSNRSG